MRKLMLLTAMLMALVVLSIGYSGIKARGKRISEDSMQMVKGGYDKANNWLTPSPRPLGEQYVRNVGNNVAQILTAEQYKDRAKNMVKKILAAVSGDRSFMGIRFTPRSVVYVNGRAKEVVRRKRSRKGGKQQEGAGRRW